jgi:hypothetical protein
LSRFGAGESEGVARLEGQDEGPDEGAKEEKGRGTSRGCGSLLGGGGLAAEEIGLLGEGRGLARSPARIRRTLIIVSRRTRPSATGPCCSARADDPGAGRYNPPSRF